MHVEKQALYQVILTSDEAFALMGEVRVIKLGAPDDAYPVLAEFRDKLAASV